MLAKLNKSKTMKNLSTGLSFQREEFPWLKEILNALIQEASLKCSEILPVPSPLQMLR